MDFTVTTFIGYQYVMFRNLQVTTHSDLENKNSKPKLCFFFMVQQLHLGPVLAALYATTSYITQLLWAVPFSRRLCLRGTTTRRCFPWYITYNSLSKMRSRHLSGSTLKANKGRWLRVGCVCGLICS